MSFHGGLANLTGLLKTCIRRCKVNRQGQVRRRRHLSGPREDGVQSRTLAGEQIPKPSAEAPQDCSESASDALENPFVDVTVSFCPAILPRCSHVICVKEDAVCIRDFVELSAHKILFFGRR